MHRIISILFFLTIMVSLSWCIFRDTRIERQYPGDLRNRVVGSRLQKDGHPPYFYKWKNGETLRYYDPQNFDTLRVSNITASPFFHQLLYPLADTPQRTISKIWLVLEYLMWLFTTFLAIRLARERPKQIAVLVTATLFLYTNAWTGHVASGQMYLCIPFLAMLFYSCIQQDKKTGYAAGAGLLAAVLLLIRPTTLLFLLPSGLLLQRASLRYKIIFCLSAGLVFFLAFNSGQKLDWWNDYRLAIAEQLKSHQQLGAARQLNDADPGYAQWEGWDRKEREQAGQAFPYHYNMEHGNVFVLINHSLHLKTPVSVLALAAFLFITGLSVLFYRKYRPPASFRLYPVALLSFCLYMTADIFSPIHRFQYNGIQWLFPLLLAAAHYDPRYRRIYAGLLAGLLLNSISLSFMVMEQTIGEFMIWGGLLFLLLHPEPRTHP